MILFSIFREIVKKLYAKWKIIFSIGTYKTIVSFLKRYSFVYFPKPQPFNSS